MRSATRQLFLFAAAALTALGCGAPVKSAGEVKSIFEGDATSLQEKVSTLCDELYARSEPPSLEGVDLDVNGCADAGLAALNLKDITSFSFLGLDGTVPPEEEEQIINRAVRAQVWLNKSLIGMAGAVAKKIKKNKAEGNNTGVLNLPDSGQGGLSNFAKPSVEVLEEPNFDTQKFTFSTAIHLKVTGGVKVDNVIRVSGGLVENKFAIIVKSDGAQEYKDSIVRDFSAMILIVPHASDVYLDLFVNVNIYNPGLEKLVKDQISSFLSSGLKGVIDGFFTL